MLLISGSSNLQLAKSLAPQLGAKMIEVELSSFANQERRVWIKNQVQGENITIVQSFSRPVDSHIMETLLIMDALERMGARHVNLVIPWLGYSMQDKVFRSGEPISAKVIASIVSHGYVKRIYLLDLHNSSIPGFFSVPTFHLDAQELFAEYIRENFSLDEVVVVSPDFGGLKRARSFAQLLGVDLANIDKQRDLKTGQVTTTAVHGEVRDKIAILFDDNIQSGGTAIETGKLLKQNGAQAVHFVATHGIFVPGALEKLSDSALDSIVITNSISHPTLPEKIKVLDCSSIFSDALKVWQ